MKMTAATALNDLRQLQPEQLLARASAVLPPWISALLVLGLAWKLAALTWALVPRGEPKPVAPPPAGTPASGAEAATSPDVLQKIVAMHLFGEFKQDEVPVTPSEDFPESQNYKLLGVYFSSDDPKASIAIIVDDRNEAHVYAVGDALARGARLSAVEPTRVVIQRGSSFEKIELPQEADMSAGPAPMRTARAATPPPPTRPDPVPGTGTNPLADALAQAPQVLTELIRPQPVFADGKQLGYRVYPGRNRQQFTKLGLKPGDLVTQINGAPLDDPARGLEIFRVLEEGSQVSVTVERDGQPQVIVLDANTLNSLESGASE
jgi:general secretion pathway protein C